MKRSHMNIFLTAGVVTLLLLSGCASGIIRTSQSNTTNVSQQENTGVNDTAMITSYVGGVPHSQMISYESGVYLKELFSELALANAHDPCSAETQQLQKQIIIFAEEQELLPAGMSADKILAQLGKRGQSFATKSIGGGYSVYSAGIGREMFCNFVATGEGAAFPIIILPRFIPFIMAPIPRLFVGWKTSVGFTSVGGLVSGTGFYAAGQQQGFALGFWGIGFSIFLPPVRAYGMFGYALYAKVTAEYMEYYPPNHPPEITATYPLDGAMYVPLSTSELRFSLSDYDSDLMSYSVTTYPDVGGGNGNMKSDGTYTIPVSGLKSSTKYTWNVTVSDGMDTVEEAFSFTTEAVAPIVSEERPLDGDRYVPETQNYLSFHLRDPQNDLMSYTVETSPFIGSGSGSGVGEGDITVPISGLEVMTEYRWYVNATDGENPTSETFWFRTGPLMVFDPFEEGWEYRKMITVDHAMVADDLHNFPVLLSFTDSDLRDKAQDNGDDILFMDGSGVATRLYHELEEFDGSTGRVVAWVNVSSLSSTVDTSLYMYYGNIGSYNQQCPEKTWDSHYIAVWHMKDNTTSTITESTSMNNEATKSAANKPSETTGKIGESQEYNGVSGANGDSAYITHNGNLNMAKDGTISFWLYLDGDLADYQSLVLNNGGSNYQIFIQDTTLELGYYSSISGILDTNQAISTGTWIYITSVVDNGKISLYFNDMLKYNANFAFGAVSTQQVRIGNLQVMSKPLDGKLDEARISNIQRTATWISTEYNNQNSPSTFLSIGLEESHP